MAAQKRIHGEKKGFNQRVFGQKKIGSKLMSERRNSRNTLISRELLAKLDRGEKVLSEQLVERLKRSVKLAGEYEQRLRSQELNEYEAFTRVNAEREQKKIREIQEKMLRELGLNIRELGRDRRFYAVSRALLEIFGEKITPEQIRNANNILSMELRTNSPILENSPSLRREIDRMKYGRVSEQGQRILTQVINDILEKHGMI